MAVFVKGNIEEISDMKTLNNKILSLHIECKGVELKNPLPTVSYEVQMMLRVTNPVPLVAKESSFLLNKPFNINTDKFEYYTNSIFEIQDLSSLPTPEYYGYTVGWCSNDLGDFQCYKSRIPFDKSELLPESNESKVDEAEPYEIEIKMLPVVKKKL
ncbi:hypothetical protein HMI56_005337 [Coelomomyces lativittatus]|nr:hypothetical protein HMI56_005337 [Coelomomyces lativittatus]